MFERIKRLVYRTVKDEAGNEVQRLERYEAELSAGGPDLPKMPPATPAHDGDIARRIGEAAAGLSAVNIDAARRFALGSETRYDVDQADGRLRLTYPNGALALFPVQFLGSFDPADRSFMWAWANPSLEPGLTRLAHEVRGIGEAAGNAALTTAKSGLSFEDITPMMAFAAAADGTPLVYRAIVNDHVSLFMALGAPSFTNADGATAASPFTLPVATAAELAAAEHLVAGYDRDGFEADKVYRANRKADGALSQAVAQKMVAFERDWHRDDDEWRPSSAGWPSGHDWDLDRQRFSAPHPSGGIVHVRISEHGMTTARHVRTVAGEPKIVDEIIGWGAAFVWP
jgi:hypothetical protein